MSKRDWQRDMEICRKATAPLWSISISSNGDYYLLYQMKDKKPIELIAEVPFIENAIFIAEAREGWPAALEKIRELEQQMTKMRDVLSNVLSRYLELSCGICIKSIKCEECYDYEIIKCIKNMLKEAK